MKKIVILKRFLPLFLMLFGLGLTGVNAQSLQQQDGKVNSDMQILSNSNPEATVENLVQEIRTLKASLLNYTSGSPASVDALRRIKVYDSAATAIQNGDSAMYALQAGKETLYKSIESKATEKPLLRLIEQDLQNLLSN